MKRLLLFTAVIFTLMGCDNKFEDVGNSRQMISDLPTLTVAFDEDATRTYVESNKYLRWHEGDLISAFIGDTRNCKYQFEGKTGDNSGTFVSVESSLGSSEKLDRIYALYPYDKSATITTKGVISCSLSAIQTYATNSFAQNVNTMVSATSGVNDGDIIFKNVGGYLKIRLYGEGTVKSIELRGNNGEKIAGNANITATYGGVPKIAMADDATESIMLDCGDGVELSADAENPTEFWFVVPPMEFSKGITIVATDINNSTFVQNTSKKVVVERNMIQPMAAIEVEFEVYDPTKPAKNEIWYTSTDGEIVTPYRSNVFGATIVSNTYEDGKGVITFDGAVTTIREEAFYDCDSLTSVIIGDSVTTIGGFAFSYCDGLTSVTIPDSVTTIGDYAFYSCESLTSVTIGDSVTTIGDEAFYNCYSLTSVTIPDSVTTIGEGAFAGCTSLKEFNGKFAEDNGRCLIVDNTLIAYANKSGTEYTIPDSVTTIGDLAFFACNSLTSVTIPDSVTTIGNVAFLACNSLTSVTIPDSVTTIRNYAFSYCESLTSVYCKATTPPTMDDDVFANAPLEAIYVPTASVNDYKTAYGWCDYADYIIGYDFDNGEIATPKPAHNEIWYTSSDGEIVTPNTSNVFGATIVSNTYEDGKGVITFDGVVTTIGKEAFYSCDSLTSITIPDSVTTIGWSAFNACYSLTSITIPDSVTTIGDYAFAACDSLTNVTIGGSVTTIGAGAFEWCGSLKEFRGKYAADNGRCLIMDNTIIAYAEASGTEYTIPDSVTTIGNDAFYCCSSLTSVTIPDSVTTIGNDAFLGCVSLTSVTIPDSVTTIGREAFYRCESFTSVTIPDSVTTIGVAAFSNCNSLKEFKGKYASDDGRCLIIAGTLNSFAPAGLTEYTIPDSVTTIGERAFIDCTSITSVTIGDSVTTIGDMAFYSCDSLTSVYCKATTPPSIGYGVFNDNANSRKIYVPTASVNDYKTADGWCDYADYIIGYDFDNGEIATPKPANNEIWYTSTGKISIPVYAGGLGATITTHTFDTNTQKGVITCNGNITTIGDYTFGPGGYGLTSLTMPDSVTSIGYAAFSGCSNLTSVTLSNNLTTIGESAFEGCKSLTSVIIPNSVKDIKNKAFYGCISLMSIAIPDSVTTIEGRAFSGCKNLASVTIGNNVTTIGNSAFYDCDSLTSITIPDNVTNIGESAFAFCDKLTSATIGNGITRIENCLFDSCPELVSITIPNSVISIGDFAFSDCQKLLKVTIPNSVTTIGEYSFQVCKDLTDLTIPDSVTSIGTRAFTGCGLETLRFGKNIPDLGYEVFTYNSNLRTVYSEDPTPPEINGRQPFYGISQDAILYVPRSYVGTYEDNNGWRWSFKDILAYDF